MHCAICLENMENESAICTTECGHKFHSGCIFKAFSNKNECPLCRKQLVENSKLPTKIIFEFRSVNPWSSINRISEQYLTNHVLYTLLRNSDDTSS